MTLYPQSGYKGITMTDTSKDKFISSRDSSRATIAREEFERTGRRTSPYLSSPEREQYHTWEVYERPDGSRYERVYHSSRWNGMVAHSLIEVREAGTENTTEMPAASDRRAALVKAMTEAYRAYTEHKARRSAVAESATAAQWAEFKARTRELRCAWTNAQREMFEFEG